MQFEYLALVQRAGQGRLAFLGDGNFLSARLGIASPFGKPVLRRQGAHGNVIAGSVVTPLSDSIVAQLQGLSFRLPAAMAFL